MTATPQLPSRNTSPLAQGRAAEHLAGAADKATPGWQERVAAAVNALESKRGRTGLQVWVDLRWRRLLRLAAESRGMTSGSYARRAMSAFIAADLGIDPKDVLALCPQVVPAGQTGHAAARAKRAGDVSVDDGDGYGTWGIADE